jgi:hypothetical protein
LEAGKSNVTVRNCVISGNHSTSGGGGLAVSATMDVRNTIISDNYNFYATALGGGVFLCDGTLSMTNTVVVNNGQSTYGSTGGIDAVSCTSATTLKNEGILKLDSSIVFNNYGFQIKTAQIGGFPEDISGITVSYSAVQGGFSGTGNISANPLFLDTDFHLVPDASPCVDAGNPGTDSNDGCLPPGLGQARNDMGAYGGPLACSW